MRNHYFISYAWYSDHYGSGRGRCEIKRHRNICDADDLREIEDMISEFPTHRNKNVRIVIQGWQRFEPPIRDRAITRKALAKGMRAS
jgi:hypothetical protein